MQDTDFEGMKAGLLEAIAYANGADVPGMVVHHPGLERFLTESNMIEAVPELTLSEAVDRMRGVPSSLTETALADLLAERELEELEARAAMSDAEQAAWDKLVGDLETFSEK